MANKTNKPMKKMHFLFFTNTQAEINEAQAGPHMSSAVRQESLSELNENSCVNVT